MRIAASTRQAQIPSLVSHARVWPLPSPLSFLIIMRMHVRMMILARERLGLRCLGMSMPVPAPMLILMLHAACRRTICTG
jgi:hypothetical protein